ncbi:NAD(P)H-dependent FMN reductase [Thermomonospora echinospora]|uniref:NAD(P)H-dependent FMN reductase n=1 Tax=Thermomonospora echinospora TaxID=1992 RepID=A0A1H6DLP5_9ACTN|nr:NAD(P)H-dependent oxidoreductase [Thermomonospora echinospora]SEG85636.1 NAD(P)H-dependent FMN reductase [Thermomonospora echinospora]
MIRNECPLRVAVVIGSTREGRIGDAVGRWFVGVAGRCEGVELEVLDLLDHELPVRHPGAVTPQMAAFAGRIGQADGFVVVTPEYNRSFPASLKQAIDCAYDEWRAKPVGFVSYGYRFAGLYAVEQLRPVFTELHVVTMPGAVHIDLRHCDFARGRPPDEGLVHEAETMLGQLIWWGLALRDARAARPYAC